MQQNSSKINLDNFDFFLIFEWIWNDKWLIIFFTTLCIVLGGLYVAFKPESYLASLEINKQTSHYISSYRQLNNVIGEVPTVYTLGDFEIPIRGGRASITVKQYMPVVIAPGTFPFSGDPPIMTVNTLMDKFSVEARSFLQIKEAIREYAFEVKNFVGTEDEKEQLINEIASTYVFKPHYKKSDKFSHYTLEYETNNKEESSTIVVKALDLINQSVQKKFIEEVEEYRDAIQSSIKNSIIRLQDEIEIATFNYQLEKENKLAYLKEQSSIARGLNIEENILAGTNFKDTSVIDDFIIERKEEKVVGERNVVDTIKYNLRGYKAIEKEIELLENRKDASQNSIYIESITSFETQIKRLNKDRRVSEINEVLALPEFHRENFSSVIYDLSLMQYEKVSEPNNVLFFSLFLGLITSIFYVLFVATYKQYKLNE